MRKDKGEVDADRLDGGNLGTVVIEHIVQAGDPPQGDAAERVRRRRLLRRLLRRPAARIASRRLSRKRMLAQLDLAALRGGFADLRNIRFAALRRTLRQVPAPHGGPAAALVRPMRWQGRAVPHGYAARSRLRSA